MEKQQHILKPNQRVRLRDGFDHFYMHARSGAEGVVKAVDHDHLGFPHALVEWDEYHWTYEGEQSGWTFQTHFEPVGEEPMSEEKDTNDVDPKKVAEVVAAVMQAMRDVDEDDRREPESEAVAEMRAKEQYMEAVEASIALLQESDAFMVIAVHSKKDSDGSTMLIPDTITFSLTDEGTLALEAQVGVMMLTSHNTLITDRLNELNRIRREKEK